MRFEIIYNKAKYVQRKRLAVAAAADAEVLESVAEAQAQGYISAVLVGGAARIREIAQSQSIDISAMSVIDEPAEEAAAAKAVELIRTGQADFLMKGLLQTATLMRAVLDKERGIISGALLSHVACIDTEALGRPIFVSDGAINIAPDLRQKADILRNAVAAVRPLGYERPRVAALAALELVNPNMPCTLDAAALTQMNRRGQIKDCIVDGPLALDNAVSHGAAEQKNIGSECAGCSDILLAPDLEAGNMLVKAAKYLGGCAMAGVVMGAKAPIVMTSRADSAQSKLASIAWATIVVSC